MKLLELTLDSDPGNLALDEALLETAESAPNYPEVLRLWEPIAPLVVLGRSSPAATEANLDYCNANNISVLSRCSGGQSIVTGPGCLMYAVVLDFQKRPQLRSLDNAHQFVMTKMQKAIATVNVETQMEGTSDLTFNGRKFSGNALRCKRDWMVYHGTMICDFDIQTISKCLGKPIREPDYRRSRNHDEFLTQLPTRSVDLSKAIADEWTASELLDVWPEKLTDKLVNEKYATMQWTHKIP